MNFLILVAAVWIIFTYIMVGAKVASFFIEEKINGWLCVLAGAIWPITVLGCVFYYLWDESRSNSK